MEPASTDQRPSSPASPALTLGAILIIIGLLLFVAQLTGFTVGELGWPMIIVGIGVVLLAVGLFVNREEGLVVAGTITTTVGLVLLYQNETGHWASWAYAWALVGPAASGLGLIIWGLRAGSPSDVRNGTWSLLSGLALFVVGYLFFEGVIGISGERLPLPEWVLPAVVIVIGVVVLGRGLLWRGEAEQT
jgi:hypothetical protein